MVKKSVAIIGGGAAGFFTAINLAERSSIFNINIFEGSNKLLSKVLISGGGRCNVTNAERSIENLLKKYPRGYRILNKIFEKFSTGDTYQWFEERGVKLKIEADGRVFPKSNSSQTIYNCFLEQSNKLGIQVNLKHRLRGLKKEGNGWRLDFGETSFAADVVVFCTGGNDKIWSILNGLGIETAPPIPSLFTIKLKEQNLAELSGISLPNSVLKIAEKRYTGPLLITHTGLSGPVSLSLSAWEARNLASKNYSEKMNICWDANLESQELQLLLKSKMHNEPKEKVRTSRFHSLPKRLYALLCDSCDIKEFTNWSELGKKKMNTLVSLLTNYPVNISGKSTFKEEFVTAGGVILDQLDLSSMECKDTKGLFFAGEVLNIDAETGGYNFQAAWSTAYLVACGISKAEENK